MILDWRGVGMVLLWCWYGVGIGMRLVCDCMVLAWNRYGIDMVSGYRFYRNGIFMVLAR